MIFIFLNIAIIIFFCIYWCINEKIGFQLCIVVLLSTWTTHFLNDMGIEFPINLEIGWLIIALFFCGYIFLRKKINALFLKFGFRVHMIAAAAVSFLLIIYHPYPYFVVPGGVLLGLGLGYCLNKKYVGFSAANTLQRIGIKKYLTLLARPVLGIAILLIMVYRIEKIIYGMSENQNIFLYGFLCYTLIGFWVTIAAPWLFIKFHIAGTISENDKAGNDKKSENKHGSHWFQS